MAGDVALRRDRVEVVREEDERAAPDGAAWRRGATRRRRDGARATAGRRPRTCVGELLLVPRLGRDVDELEQPLGEALAIRSCASPAMALSLPRRPSRRIGTVPSQIALLACSQGSRGTPWGSWGTEPEQPARCQAAYTDARNDPERGIIRA